MLHDIQLDSLPIPILSFHEAELNSLFMTPRVLKNKPTFQRSELHVLISVPSHQGFGNDIIND